MMERRTIRIVLPPAIMFFAGGRPAMSQVFLDKIKKAVKKVKNVVGSIGETVGEVNDGSIKLLLA